MSKNTIHTETVTYKYDEMGRVISKTTVNEESERADPTPGIQNPDAPKPKVNPSFTWPSFYPPGQFTRDTGRYDVFNSVGANLWNEDLHEAYGVEKPLRATVFDLSVARKRREMTNGYL